MTSEDADQRTRHAAGQDDAEHADRRARHAYATGQIDIAALEAWLTLIASGNVSAQHMDATLPPAPARDPSRGGSPRWYPADLDVITELAAIGDPRERFRRAAAITDSRYAAQQEARQRQVIAAVAAHVRHGASQVACYAELGMGRRHFQKAVKQAPAVLPDFPSAATALEEVQMLQQPYEQHRGAATTARLVRDREIIALTSGQYGEPVRAIRLAEDIGVTKALISWVTRQPAAA